MPRFKSKITAGAGMRKLTVLFLLSAGCSTAPLADTLDYFKPGKIEAGGAPPYGGVCSPQPGGLVAAPGAPAAPVIGPTIPPPPPSGAPSGVLPMGPTPLIMGPTAPQPNVPAPQFPP
jgi:hypothetical protein